MDGDSIGLINEQRFRHKWTPYLLFCNCSAVVGSALVFGYVGVMVNEPYKIFERFINNSYHDQHNHTHFLDDVELENLWSLTVSLFLIGGLFGALLGGPQANRFGRKNSLMIDSIIGIVAGGCLLFSPSSSNF